MRKVKIGDRLTFCSPTRWGPKRATRVVTGFYNDKPTVRYGGWGNFIVEPHEIIAVSDGGAA